MNAVTRSIPAMSATGEAEAGQSLLPLAQPCLSWILGIAVTEVTILDPKKLGKKILVCFLQIKTLGNC